MLGQTAPRPPTAIGAATGRRGTRGGTFRGLYLSSPRLVDPSLTLTSAVDDLAWVALLLCVIRARVRPDPRYWLVGGGVAGLATSNKLLIAVLLLSLGVALLTLRPRQCHRRWSIGGQAKAVAQ